MERWVGKVALVTGASVGIGAATATALVRQGMTVVGCARNMDKIKVIQKELEAESATGRLHAIQCDLTKRDQISAMFREIRRQHKLVHVCINNAGLCFDGSLVNGSPADWQTMLDVNIMALCICTQESIKMMKDNGFDDGHIIHLGSMSGHRVSGHRFYSGTKFMVRGLTEALRKDLREMNSSIRVTEISPGAVETEFHPRLLREDPATCDFYKKIPTMQAEGIADEVIHVLQRPPSVEVHGQTDPPRHINTDSRQKNITLKISLPEDRHSVKPPRR
ncbi:dehydrogenase/reductase SDR family member 11-like [Diadema setosum]|uniref:dehydrogenase/reductase SDR family member 11-like n=1 Tax=Diadema setosum TaxID=31175 RepID=UPI003B3AAC86